MHRKMYTDQEVFEAVRSSINLSQVLKKLGLQPKGANYASIKKKIALLDADCSHFHIKVWNDGRQLKEWSQYTNTTMIKKRLIEERGVQCESCTLTHWLQKPITLELHHIDGDRNNNSKENLQLLCPNCHSTTPNWRGRK